MTPKEKAKELYNKFYENSYVPWMGGKDEATTKDCAKDSASICVDEILNLRMIGNMSRGFDSVLSEREYWIEVKKEIQNLYP